MTRPYILTKGAEADLRDIMRYTVAKWGENQCRVYMSDLAKKAETLDNFFDR